MKKIAIPILLALAVPTPSLQAERPILMSDINPSQLYSKQQIEVEINNISQKDNGFSILQSEYLMLKAINKLDEQHLSKDDVEFLNQHTQYQSQSFIKHDEGPLPLAIFDIASAAKYKLNQYYVHDKAKEYQRLLESSWENYKQALKTKDLSQVQLAAKLESMNGLNDSQYSEIAKELIVSRNYQSPLVVKAVSNSNDASLVKALLLNSASADANRLLAEKLYQFSNLEQADILQSVVVKNKALASSALMQYAKLPNNVRSNDWLVSQLSDSYLGASAAKAIGITQSQNALSSAKELILDDSSNRTQVANALLALKFANNDYAKSELNELLERDLIKFKDMQQEVAKWLD